MTDLLTLRQAAQDRPHDDDVILGTWTITPHDATPQGTHALEGDLTAFLNGGTFDHDNAPGTPPERRRRYRVQHVERSDRVWRRLTFNVTRTDRYGNDTFLTVYAEVTSVPSVTELRRVAQP